MKMKSMKLDGAKEQGQAVNPVNNSPRYPYGLNIRLENDSIEKLDIEEMPEVGEVVMIMAHAKVESVSMNEQADGKKYKSISLQITDMSLSEMEEKKDIMKAMYGER